MSEFTPFAGLIALDPADPLSTDDFSFQVENPQIIDALLRLGAQTHKHDGHAALDNPTRAGSALVMTTGGTIPADQNVYLGYTLLDAYGGETALVDEVTLVTTQPGLAIPAAAPTVALDHVAGTLLAGSYSYAVTVTDGLGGESGIGPTVTIEIPPGFALSEIVVSDLDDIVTANGGVGWRLWRRVNGGAWNLVNTGVTASVTDDGSLCFGSNVQPPTSTSQTSNGTNKVRFTIPAASAGTDSDFVGFRVYFSEDGLFGSPSLLGSYPTSSAGVGIDYTALSPTTGSPPEVTRSYAGANPIDPDTDILDWHWKRPVQGVGDLPTASAGDVRYVKNASAAYANDGISWFSLLGSPGHMIASANVGNFPQQGRLKFIGSGAAIVTISDDNANDLTEVKVTVVPVASGGGGGGATTKRYLAEISGLPTFAVRSRVPWAVAAVNSTGFTTADSGGSIIVPETGLYHIDAKLYVIPNDNSVAFYETCELIACADPTAPSAIGDVVDADLRWIDANGYEPYISVHGQKYLTAGDKIAVFFQCQRQSDDSDRQFDFQNNASYDNSYIAISKVS